MESNDQRVRVLVNRSIQEIEISCIRDHITAIGTGQAFEKRYERSNLSSKSCLVSKVHSTKLEE